MQITLPHDTDTERYMRRAQKSHNRLLLSFLFNSCRSSVCVCRPATSRVGCSFVPDDNFLFVLHLFTLLAVLLFFTTTKTVLIGETCDELTQIFAIHFELTPSVLVHWSCRCWPHIRFSLMCATFQTPDVDEKLDGEFGTQYLFSPVELTNTDWHYNSRLLRNVEILNQDSLEHATMLAVINENSLSYRMMQPWNLPPGGIQRVCRWWCWAYCWIVVRLQSNVNLLESHVGESSK